MAAVDCDDNFSKGEGSPTAPIVSVSDEDRAASDPLLVESASNHTNVDGSVATNSLKDDVATARHAEVEVEPSHSWEEGGFTGFRHQQGTGRSGISIWCSTEGMWNELTKLSYAPYDLFIVYTIKVAECFAYYALSYIFAHYLTEEFGMSDQEAGNLYTYYGLLCTVIGLLMGVSIDRLGVRRSMIFGCVCSTFARLLVCVSNAPFICYLSVLTVAPLGAAFGVPSMALAVRRYTHESNRAMAFSLFYCAMCLACLLSSFLINVIRSNYPDGVDILGSHFSWMRLVVLWSTLATGYSIFAASHVRDIQVLSEQPLEASALDEARKNRVRTSLRDILEQKRFWRLAAVTLIFCGVRMVFRHMDATFPKYFMRTHGHDAPFELILSIEPLLTMLLTPVVTFVLNEAKLRLDQILLVGAFISGISGFVLVIEETYASAIGFVCVLALGESIWSPKLYEFSTMSAPEGREGVYVAITFAPMYLASVPVGAFSGWALSTFCGRNWTEDHRHGQFMWFLIGLKSFSSFLLLFFFRRRLFPKEDLQENEDEDEEGDSL